MNVSKTASTIGVGAAIIVGSLLAVTTANAHSSNSEQKQAERVSAFAERFNLDETEVRTYFEEQKAGRESERESKKAEHMASLVESGALTQAQADELTKLKDEARDSIRELKESGAENEEIRALIENNRSEIKSWAEGQGINLESIKPEHEHGPKGHGEKTRNQNQ